MTHPAKQRYASACITARGQQHALVLMSSLNCSSCFCPTTRVLPNQRLSGWMRLLGSSLDWKSCSKQTSTILAVSAEAAASSLDRFYTSPQHERVYTAKDTVQLQRRHKLPTACTDQLTCRMRRPFLSLIALLLYILRRRTCRSQQSFYAAICLAWWTCCWLAIEWQVW